MINMELTSICSIHAPHQGGCMDTLPKPVKVVKPKGRNYQLYYYSPDGVRRRLSVGPVHQRAQRLAIKCTEWLLEGKDPEREMKRSIQASKATNITLREFFKVFMENHGLSLSLGMQKRFEVFFDNMCRCPQLADSSISEISKGLVLDYLRLRMKENGISPATANREGSFFRNMLNRAVEWDILERNPLQGIRLFKESGKRNVNLTPDQAKALLDELPSSVADIVEFAIYTGFRKENILSLRIEQLRFHDITPTGEVDLFVKGGRNETFPLGCQAVGLLRRVINNRKEGYVFISPKSGTRWVSIHKPYNKAVQKLGLKTLESNKLCFHDLRHVFGTWLSEAGVSLDEIRPLMGIGIELRQIGTLR